MYQRTEEDEVGVGADGTINMKVGENPPLTAFPTRKALYSYFVGKGGSEMNHIQNDYKVKMCIPQQSANQHVVIVGERNDEDHALHQS